MLGRLRIRRGPVHPIIIGGCFRSGTSLLRRLLNAHSRIYCGPEVKFFRDLYGDYFHDPLQHLRFTASARTMLGEDDLLDVLGRAFIDMHAWATAQAGKARWADKNPENVLYLDQWQRLLGDGWRFVLLVRNPLDTLASMTEAGFPLTIPVTLDERIALYLRYTLAGWRFADAHPDRSYVLAYERLVLEPEERLRALMAWLGEDYEPAQLCYNDFPHQTGLEDPKVVKSSRIVSNSVGRWRSVFGQAEAEQILAATRGVWDRMAQQRDLAHVLAAALEV
jgi:hypothetical protein